MTPLRRLSFLPTLLLLGLASCGGDDAPAAPAPPEPPPAPGALSISVEPTALPAPWRLAGPQGLSQEGTGAASVNGVPAGAYTLTWLPLEGWDPPTPPQDSRTLAPGGSLTFTGSYQPWTGRVSIRVEPADAVAPWLLTGPGNAVREGAGSETLEGIPVGAHTLQWLPLEGWIQPEPASATGEVRRNETLTLEGTYLPATGTVIVSVLPQESNGAWRLVGPNGPLPVAQGSRTLEGLPPGSYTLRWIGTQGWELPAPVEVSFTLQAGQTRTLEGTYRAASASLNVELRPGAIPAPWRLTDPLGVDTAGEGAALLSGLQSGRYRMTWFDVLGWTTPPAVEIEIAEGEQVSVQGRYPLMSDPYATNDSLGRVAALGGSLVPAEDDVSVLLEVPLARLDPEGGSRFFGFTSDPGSAIALRLDPMESFLHPLDAQNLGIRLWRQDSSDGGGWTLMGQINLQPRGAGEYHSPIFYSGSGFAGDGTWAMEVYSSGERTGRQLFRVRIANRAIEP